MIDRTQMPDARTWLLPMRAYLRSFEQQTVPVRRWALADNRAALDAATDDHAQSLALVGLVGDALQPVEDVAVLGTAMSEGYEGLPFYTRATVYSSRSVTNFYGQLKNRPREYILGLAALWMGDRPLHDWFEFVPPLEPADEEAIAAALGATELLLRDHLAALGRAWDTWRPFYLAYKHALLLANPDDVTIVEHRERDLTRLAVWRRRRATPEISAYSELKPARLADLVEEVAGLALEVVSYFVDTRMQMFDRLKINVDGTVEQLSVKTVPWLFWMRSSDISEEHLKRLRVRFGIVLADVEASASNEKHDGPAA